MVEPPFWRESKGQITGVGKIGIHPYPSVDNVLFVEGLKYNLLSIVVEPGKCTGSRKLYKTVRTEFRTLGKIVLLGNAIFSE